jgi:hypothetical protein
VSVADLAIAWVLLSVAFIAAVVVTSLCRVAHRWFCEALDSAAEQMR